MLFSLTFRFFLSQFISFDERNANSAIDQRKCKGQEKRERLLVSKEDFNFQKKTPIDPVFSNWVNFIRKLSINDCSWNSKSFKAIFFEI